MYNENISRVFSYAQRVHQVYNLKYYKQRGCAL